ncbi:hypothetical protein, partial [Escherichia coli]|uniref:hypothetical protein n=1 Tax=Escherichia coli TaxID=562 RepID=UPI001BC8303E
TTNYALNVRFRSIGPQTPVWNIFLHTVIGSTGEVGKKQPGFIICSFSVFLFCFVLIQFRGLALAGGLQCQLQPVSGAYTGNSTAQKSVSWLCNVIA